MELYLYARIYIHGVHKNNFTFTLSLTVTIQQDVWRVLEMSFLL